MTERRVPAHLRPRNLAPAPAEPEVTQPFSQPAQPMPQPEVAQPFTSQPAAMPVAS